MENKQVLNLDKLIEISKNKEIKYIYIGCTNIKIRNFIYLRDWEEYNKNFKETNDYKIAFIKMLISMMEVDEQNNSDISYSIIEQISDDELLQVMNEIINQEDYLKEYFSSNNCDISYENFYNAYKYQSERLTEIFKEALTPVIDTMIQLKKQIGNVVTTNLPSQYKINFPKISIPNLKYPQLNNIFEPTISQNTDYIEKYNLESEIFEAQSQKDVVNEIIAVNQYTQKNTEILLEILNVIKDDQQSQKKSEKKSRRLSIYSISIAIFGLIISIILHFYS